MADDNPLTLILIRSGIKSTLTSSTLKTNEPGWVSDTGEVVLGDTTKTDGYIKIGAKEGGIMGYSELSASTIKAYTKDGGPSYITVVSDTYASGNVGFGVTPGTALGARIVVNGNATVSGSVTVSGSITVSGSVTTPDLRSQAASANNLTIGNKANFNVTTYAQLTAANPSPNAGDTVVTSDGLGSGGMSILTYNGSDWILATGLSGAKALAIINPLTLGTEFLHNCGVVFSTYYDTYTETNEDLITLTTTGDLFPQNRAIPSVQCAGNFVNDTLDENVTFTGDNAILKIKLRNWWIDKVVTGFSDDDEDASYQNVLALGTNGVSKRSEEIYVVIFGE